MFREKMMQVKVNIDNLFIVNILNYQILKIKLIHYYLNIENTKRIFKLICRF